MTSPKSPAFQFYPDNFVSGAPAFMKPLETHVYMWLICLEWTRGGFVFDEAGLASWCRIPVVQFRKAWPKVSESFELRDGRYFNGRLDKERDKQREYSERMSANGKKGGRPKAAVKPELSKPESRGLADGKPTESTPFLSPTPVTTTTPARAGFDLGPYLEAHREHFPDSDPPAGRYGKTFKRLEAKHGAPETLRRWRLCLARKVTFATPEELAAHWPEYETEPLEQAIVDEYGCLTAYGERLTRPHA